MLFLRLVLSGLKKVALPEPKAPDKKRSDREPSSEKEFLRESLLPKDGNNTVKENFSKFFRKLPPPGPAQQFSIRLVSDVEKVENAKIPQKAHFQPASVPETSPTPPASTKILKQGFASQIPAELSPKHP
ncbi:MAG TPA: hypothetical protein EYP81_02235 [Thermodesulfobacteriaceae bacterium]|nr:hypothetical protein [Thermodesulfobacteriaceae bacterium]